MATSLRSDPGDQWKRSIYDYRRALSPKGKYFMVGGSDKQSFKPCFSACFVEARWPNIGHVSGQGKPERPDVSQRTDRSGKINVIDRRYPLSETPDAMRYIAKATPRQRSLLMSFRHLTDSLILVNEP